MEKLLAIKDVIELLGVTKNYVYKLKDNGLMRFLLIGSWKTTESFVEQFLQESEGWDLTNPDKPKLLPGFSARPLPGHGIKKDGQEIAVEPNHLAYPN